MPSVPPLPHVRTTAIAGLLVIDLAVHADARGSFKENWQRRKLLDAGGPDLRPVQHNVSLNARRGVTRGIHAEPWDKYVSLSTGRVFGVWVDLREGPGFGTTVTLELGTGTAVYVPRGVGNAYQVLDDTTAYSYLVTAHWSPEAHYTEVDLADPTLAIDWPIALSDPCVEISAKDSANPTLDQVTPIAPVPPAPTGRTLVIGHRGQLGRALMDAVPGAVGVDLPQGETPGLDLTDPASLAGFDFTPYAVIINAAAHTAVDAAETPEGRTACWAANATGPAALARLAETHGATLVHISSDYVFDGTRTTHTEDEPLSPLGVYGQAKAAGDLAVSTTRRHYLLRTSWLIGDGPNFVATMTRLARTGATPTVVDDQIGRLTFTTELARAITHLLAVDAPHGTYNLTSSGQPRSWAEFATAVFLANGRSADDVHPVSTTDYLTQRASTDASTTSGTSTPVAPRPAHSTLDLTKITATGFQPQDALAGLARHLGFGGPA